MALDLKPESSLDLQPVGGLDTTASKLLPTGLTGATPRPGERTFWGNIFERPGASSRAAIRQNEFLSIAGPFAGSLAMTGLFGKDAKKEAMRGALFPEEIETFQEEFVNEAIDRGEGTIKELYPESLTGVIKDYWTEPANALIDLVTYGAGKLSKAGMAKKSTQTSKVLKASKPSMSGKETRAAVKKAQQNYALATDTILENAKNIKYTDEAGNVIRSGAPKSLDDLSSAIQQTKTAVFNQYDELAKTAGGKGGFVALDDIADDLIRLSDKAEIRTLAPNLERYALDTADRLMKQKVYTLQEADDAIKVLNNQLKSFYKNPDPAYAKIAGADSFLANQLRAKVDDVISVLGEKVPGQYRQLRQRYGALRAIEPDVNKALFYQTKKSGTLLIDYSDVFTVGDIVAGITAHNPARLTRGLAGQAIKQAIKFKNNPDRAVSKAFETMLDIKNGAVPLKKTRVIGATAPVYLKQNRDR